MAKNESNEPARPKPPEDEQPQEQPDPQAEDEILEEEEEHEGAEKVMAVFAGMMPWVISLLFHVGLFLIMMFMVFVVFKGQSADEIIVPDAVLSENPGGRMTESPTQTKTKSQSKVTKRKTFLKKTTVSADAGKSKKPVDIIGVGGGGAASGASAMGMSTASGGGPKSTFFGSGGNAYNIVYVIDRSGSMIDTFDLVRLEMLRSIGLLRDSQYFHIILFSDDKNPIENPPKRLVQANRRNKKDASKFLSTVTAEGQTDPVPGLERAFQVLKGAKKQGKLVYLLTDGVFPDNKKVLAAIQRMNTDKRKVYINTFLYGHKPPEAVDVMTRIAQQNGGRYTFVEQR